MRKEKTVINSLFSLDNAPATQPNKVMTPPCFSSIIPIVVSLAAVNILDHQDDICAAVGASFAVIPVLYYSRKKNKEIMELISAVACTLLFGILGPGITVWWLEPVKWSSVGWKGWTLGGFHFGLIGWAVVRSYMTFIESVSFKDMIRSLLTNALTFFKTNDRSTNSKSGKE